MTLLDVVLEGLPAIAVGLGNGIDERAGGVGRESDPKKTVVRPGTHHGWRVALIASIASLIRLMVDLLVRGVEEAVVRALKKRAGEHGRSAEAEHRSILTAALLHPPRRKLADLLASMPDVGRDEDFTRQPEGAANTDVFG